MELRRGQVREGPVAEHRARGRSVDVAGAAAGGAVAELASAVPAPAEGLVVGGDATGEGAPGGQQTEAGIGGDGLRGRRVVAGAVAEAPRLAVAPAPRPSLVVEGTGVLVADGEKGGSEGLDRRRGGGRRRRRGGGGGRRRRRRRGGRPRRRRWRLSPAAVAAARRHGDGEQHEPEDPDRPSHGITLEVMCVGARGFSRMAGTRSRAPGRSREDLPASGDVPASVGHRQR